MNPTFFKPLMLVCAVHLLAQGSEPESLGSGRRGWLFSQDVVAKMDHPGTYKVTIAYEPNPPLGETPMGFAAGHSVVMYEDTLPDEHLKTIPRNFWGGWTSFLCYSFDKNEIFAFDRLIRLEGKKIRIYPGQVQPEARKRFALLADQIYLGVVEGKRFYWVKDRPEKIYFFEDGKNPRKVYQIKLDRRVSRPLGISKGNPAGDLALEAAALPVRTTSTPRIIQWFVINYKDAVPIE